MTRIDARAGWVEAPDSGSAARPPGIAVAGSLVWVSNPASNDVMRIEV